MKKIVLFLIISVALIQLFILSMRIYKYENILQNGKEFYFKPYPIDPRDLMNGRYIILYFGEQNATYSDKEFENIKQDERFYVGIKNENNSTIFAKAYLKKPKSGDFLLVSKYITKVKNGHIQFHLLFDRFYMNEYKAKKAEKAYNNLTKNDKFLAKVRVLDGDGVIENIYINGIPIDKYIK